MRIYKYAVPMESVGDGVWKGEIALPVNAQIYKVGEQRNILTFWCMISPEVDQHEVRKFMAFGTGRDILPVEERYEYLDTIFIGPSVWHVFEVV